MVRARQNVSARPATPHREAAKGEKVLLVWYEAMQHASHVEINSLFSINFYVQLDNWTTQVNKNTLCICTFVCIYTFKWLTPTNCTAINKNKEYRTLVTSTSMSLLG